jgi:hypothetical protein
LEAVLVKKVLIALIVLSMISVAVFAAKKKNVYPESTIKNFMDSCIKDHEDLKVYCECTLQKIQDQYTHEQFIKIDEQAQAGQTPAEFNEFLNKIAEECLK